MNPMNSDKKQVSTDALETLGTIIDLSAGRDAIHLAVEPVVAAHTLRPGEHVGFLGDGTVGLSDKPLGIVDPFLSGVVRKGERFWLVIYPRQITSLRHVWTHPAFGDDLRHPHPTVNDGLPQSYAVTSAPLIPTPSPSETWLRDFARNFDVSYEDLMSHAKEYVDHDEYWVEGDRFEGEYVPEEFWDHYQIVTGQRVQSRGSFFSCSC